MNMLPWLVGSSTGASASSVQLLRVPTHMHCANDMWGFAKIFSAVSMDFEARVFSPCTSDFFTCKDSLFVLNYLVHDSRMESGASGCLAKLRWGRFSQVYQSRLLDAGRALQRFLRNRGESWQLLLKSEPGQVDEIPAAFVIELHDGGSPAAFRVAKHAALFVQIWHPRLKLHLPSTWSHLVL